jgi:hypothetical protein
MAKTSLKYQHGKGVYLRIDYIVAICACLKTPILLLSYILLSIENVLVE